MEKILPDGTEVLVFEHVKEWGNSQDTEKYIKGVVESSKLSGDLTGHGSGFYKQIYTVIGEDGKKYIGAYGIEIVGNCYLKLADDHISYLEYQIHKNHQQIEKIKDDNMKLLDQIEDLKQLKNEKIKTLHK